MSAIAIYRELRRDLPVWRRRV